MKAPLIPAALESPRGAEAVRRCKWFWSIQVPPAEPELTKTTYNDGRLPPPPPRSRKPDYGSAPQTRAGGRHMYMYMYRSGQVRAVAPVAPETPRR